MIEYLPRIVIGNILIFNFAGMVGKCNTAAVQSLGRPDICPDIFSPSKGDGLFVICHVHPSDKNVLYCFH